MFTPKDLQLERGWPGIIEGDTSSSSRRRRSSRSSPAAAPLASTPSIRSQTSTSARRCSIHQPSATSTPLNSTSRPRVLCAARRFRPSGTRSRLLLLEPRGDLRPGGRDPLSAGHEGARLRARGRCGHRSRRTTIAGFTIMNDWSARDLQRRRDEGGARPCERQGLRHQPSGRCWLRRTSSTARAAR